MTLGNDIEMNKETEPIKLVFTSYRGSIGIDGLKVSIDKHSPKLCSYATLSFMVISAPRSLSAYNMERICTVVLDNNWGLIQDFISKIYELGIRQLVLCCWCTKEQIAIGKFCSAGTIGRYIQDRADRDNEFEFPIETEYGDGREAL